VEGTIVPTLKNLEADKAIMKYSHQQLTSATIMIVDDESINMDVVQAYLENMGYSRFILIEKSTEAMKVLEEKQPDLLLLDLMMPEVSGFDILIKVRSHEKLAHLPIIILTAATDSESKLRALDLGATDFLAKPVDPSELGLRVRNTLAAKAYQDQLAFYDPLTNLPNRQLFLDRFTWVLKEAKRHNDHLALLNIELDHFNRINDTMGMSAGDEVLRIVARRIEDVIRDADVLGHSKDTHEHANLFRLESSVFSLLLDRIDSVDSAAIVADRVIKVLRKPIKVNGADIYVTASIGIATYPVESDDSVSLMRLASSAKDYAKTRGGDSFQYSSCDINAMYDKRYILESRLRKALEKDEFVLHYQPKVDVATGLIQGVEALVRWIDTEKGLIPPNDFIPLAEDTGLIVNIGEWVLKEACTQIKTWHDSVKTPISMAVNISIKQFDDPRFFSILKKIIDRSGINPQLLTLELTESLLMQDVENKIKLMKKIKDTGVKLSIDDFGTGYSSLSYLRKLPVDELKIDRSFIMDIPENADSRAIASSVIYISHSLGLTTIAEGVETREQLRFLQQELCNQYQGFLFSKPVPADELFALLPDNK
jgi:diguanylate cyclase (GGDEF)-like protein